MNRFALLVVFRRRPTFFVIALLPIIALGAGASNPVYNWSRFAGSPAGELGSTDRALNDARFYGPRGLAMDGSGNIFVGDEGNHTIRKITPTGVVSTFAGAVGIAGTTDGFGGAARFDSPGGIAVDRAGNVFVADHGTFAVRKITPAGEVSTYAGSPKVAGSEDGSGSAARFSIIYSIAVDRLGNVYVADTLNYTIRKITPDRTVSTSRVWPTNRERPMAWEVTLVLDTPQVWR